MPIVTARVEQCAGECGVANLQNLSRNQACESWRNLFQALLLGQAHLEMGVDWKDVSSGGVLCGKNLDCSVNL